MPPAAYFTAEEFLVSGPEWFKYSHEMSTHLSDVVSGAAETCPYELARDADGWSPISVSLMSAWAVHFCGTNSLTPPHTPSLLFLFVTHRLSAPDTPIRMKQSIFPV